MKIVTIEEVQQRIEKRFPNQPFQIIHYTKMTKPFTIRCLKCNLEKTYSSCRNFLIAGPKNKNNLCSCYNSDSHFN
jgi:hypothetical protein